MMDDGNQVFFTNLIYLGFNPSIMESKHQIKFHKDMFLKPNKKAFEVVSHFLFTKLDSTLCKEKFRGCWPIFDKKQEREFRKICYDWLKDISIEYSEARFPRIVPSIFLSPGGDKFCVLYLSFSHYVLRKAIIQECSSQYLLYMPTFAPEYCKAITVILETSIDKSIKEFLKLQEVSQQLHKMWHQCARELVSSHILLKRKIKEKQEILNQKRDTFISSLSVNEDTSETLNEQQKETEFQSYLNRKQEQMEKVRKMWEKLENFKLKEQKYWDILGSVIDNNNPPVILEGEPMDFHIPNSFLQECKEQLLQKGVTKTHKDGKVDINSILQVWNVYLQFQQKKLTEAKFPNAEEWISSFKEHFENHLTNLHILQELSLKLRTEHLPAMGLSVCKLDEAFSNQISDSAVSIQDQTFQLCPQTPDFTFSPSQSTESALLSSRVFLLTPMLGSNDIVLKKQRKYVRSPLLSDPLSSPKLKSSNSKNEFRSSPIIHLEQIGNKQTTKIIHPSKSENLLKPVNIYTEQIVSSTNTDEELKIQQDVKIDSSRKENISILHSGKSLTTKKQKSPSEINENVKAKFVEKIIENVVDGSSTNSSINLESVLDGNSTLDLYEQSAFITRDKLQRTPPSVCVNNSISIPSEEEKIGTNSDNLSKSLNSSLQQIKSVFDNVFTSPKVQSCEGDAKSSGFCSNNLLDLSWDPEEEELLSNVTMPLVPIFDVALNNNKLTRHDKQNENLGITSNNTSSNSSFSFAIKGYNVLKEYNDFLQ